jgi:hypothetical protein
MKRLYTTTLMVLLTAFALQAQFSSPVNVHSGLRLSLPAGTVQYAVILNGIQYPVQHRTFILEQLPPGTATLQVGYWSGLGHAAQFIPVYSGRIPLQANMRTLANLNQRGQLRINGYEPIIPPFNPHAPGYFPPTVNPWNPQPGFPGQGFPGQGLGWGAPMAPQQFNLLLSSIRNRSFDNDKLLVAQQATRFQGMSAQQIALIMNEFSFESNRLKFAKYAFDFCVDPQNYFMVNDAFHFSSSVRSLEQHIFSRR